MEFFIFVSEQWLLVSAGLIMLYLLIWRENSKGGSQISYHELTRLVNQDEAIVLDIRDSKEFEQGHIAGAINVPMAKLAEKSKKLDKDKTVILVCKLGQTAGVAGKQLMAEGFSTVRLKGGMMEWQSNNLPQVRGKSA